MSGSIKDKVAIVGMGCTKFGALWDKGPTDLIVEAVNEACEDAGVEPHLGAREHRLHSKHHDDGLEGRGGPLEGLGAAAILLVGQLLDS